MNFPWLTVMLFLPIAGAVYLTVLPKSASITTACSNPICA